MKEQYFNTIEFTKLISLIDTNPIEAKKRFEDYLTEYPKDYSALLYYTSLLITLDKLDDAEKVLESTYNLYKNDRKYYNDLPKRKHFECNYNFTKARLFSYKKEYEKVHELTFYPYRETSNTINLETIRFFCKNHIDKPNINRDENFSYIYKQIFEYRESDFREHITKHMADYIQNLDNPNKHVFAPDFPMDEVIKEIKKNIPSSKRLLPGFFEDIYYFKYDECGRSNSKITDYFKVVCFHDTANLITMLPLNDCEKLPHIDLNYLKKDDQPVVKRKSRIELFNQRYNRT